MPAEQEIRPSKMFPDYHDKSIFSVYVDNFSEFSKLSEREAEALFYKESRVSPVQQEFVRLKKCHGVEMNEEDHTAGEVDFTRLGAHFDGRH